MQAIYLLLAAVYFWQAYGQSVAPTIAVTSAPSQYPNIDCRSACNFLTGGASEAILQNKALRVLQIPNYFRIQFDFTVLNIPAAGTYNSIFALKDSNSVNLPLQLFVSSTRNLVVYYNGALAISTGPQLNSTFASVFTTVAVQYASGWLSVSTNSDSNYYGVPVQSEANIAMLSLVTYISQASVPTAGGVVKNFGFLGKIFN